MITDQRLIRAFCDCETCDVLDDIGQQANLIAGLEAMAISNMVSAMAPQQLKI